MDKKIQFSYYHGDEMEKFSFLRIPKLLLTDRYFKDVSVEAKLLYGLLLERTYLSVNNGWIDSSGRVYIYYTIDEIIDTLNCGKQKAIKLMAELDIESGIGLIEKHRQGQGKPNKIYVKKCTSLETNIDSASADGAGMNQEVLNRDIKRCENKNTRGSEYEPQEVLKSNCNKIENKNIEKSNIDISILPRENEIKMTAQDKMDEIRLYYDLIKEKVDYEALVAQYNQEDIDEIIDLMVETMCSSASSIWIAGEARPQEFVKNKFLKIKYDHIRYVLEGCKNNTKKIHNIKSYILTTLYNSTSTLNSYYTAEVARSQYACS